MKNCDLIHDQLGWWMQYKDKGGLTRCTLMDATDAVEATLEAQEEGYNVMTVWEATYKQVVEVQIPKDVKAKGY